MKKSSCPAVTWALVLGLNGFIGFSSVAQGQTPPPANTPTIPENDAKHNATASEFLELYNKTTDLDLDNLLHGNTIEALNKAVADKPKDADVYDERGQYYLGKKQYPEALADFKKAVELAPTLALYHEHLAQVYRAQKDVDNALAEYAKAIEVEAPLTFRLGERANYFAELGRNEEALADYNKRVEIEPEGWAGHYWRGNFLFDQGQYDKALPDYQKLIELAPKDFDYRNRHARTLRLLGRYDDAIASYIVALQLNPARMDALNGLALAYWQTKSYDMAEANFQKALALVDDDILGYVYLNRGRMRYEQGKRAAALSDLAMALQTEDNLQKQGKSCLEDEGVAQIYLYRSYINARPLSIISKDTDKAAAIADATKAVQLDPTLAEQYLKHVGTALDTLDPSYGVEALLTGVAAAQPKNIDVLLALGDAQRATLHSKSAIATYTRALELDPKSPAALKNRAAAYASSATPYKEDEWLPAVADWKSYLAQRPDEVEALQSLGIAQYNAGQTTDGIATFRQLAANQPSNTYAHLLLGLGLAISGDETSAHTEVVAALLVAKTDELKIARSHFGNATTHYPANGVIKALTDSIDQAIPEDPDEGANEIPFFV